MEGLILLPGVPNSNPRTVHGTSIMVFLHIPPLNQLLTSGIYSRHNPLPGHNFTSWFSGGKIGTFFPVIGVQNVSFWPKLKM
jgi:hypothetical protein